MKSSLFTSRLYAGKQPKNYNSLDGTKGERKNRRQQQTSREQYRTKRISNNKINTPNERKSKTKARKIDDLCKRETEQMNKSCTQKLNFISKMFA